MIVFILNLQTSLAAVFSDVAGDVFVWRIIFNSLAYGGVPVILKPVYKRRSL